MSLFKYRIQSKAFLNNLILNFTEELSNQASPAPIPLYTFNFADKDTSETNRSSSSWSLDTSTKRVQVQQSSKSNQAFHKDSLNVIAKFNERRCHGMPLYGQDLIQALTINGNEINQNSKKNSNIWKGSGFNQHLTLELNHPNFWPFLEQKPNPKRSKRLRKKNNFDGLLPTLPTVDTNIHSGMI